MRLAMSDIDADDNEHDVEAGDGDGAELLIGEKMFKPLHLVAEWKE